MGLVYLGVGKSCSRALDRSDELTLMIISSPSGTPVLVSDTTPTCLELKGYIVVVVVLRKGVLVFMDDILVYSETLSNHLELLKQV